MAPQALKRITSSAMPVVALLLLVLVCLHLISGALQNTEELSRLYVPLLVTSVLGLFALVVVVGVYFCPPFCALCLSVRLGKTKL